MTSTSPALSALLPRPSSLSQWPARPRSWGDRLLAGFWLILAAGLLAGAVL